MEKALQRLAEAKMTSSSELSTGEGEKASKNIGISVVDTPPATPRTDKKPLINPALKGIPVALLEKVNLFKNLKKLNEAMNFPFSCYVSI